MQENKKIRHLCRNELEQAKWNCCINGAANGLIYATSLYLDTMAAGDWDALVLDDYTAVMPLPWRKKWGISYLYPPFTTAQLGVFGNGLSAEMVSSFLAAIPRQFRYWDFPLNHQNVFAVAPFPLYQRMNYVLPLNRPYEELHKGYRENIRRNIAKSHRYGCEVRTGIPVEAILDLTRFQATTINENDLTAFVSLYHQLHQQQKAVTYGVTGKNGALLASAAFMFSHNRAYYILVGNHPNGRTLGASHALIDAFIRDHAGRDLLLDFEGSDLRNLAFFYSSFGAREEPYAAIRLNRLPWWMKWLK